MPGPLRVSDRTRVRGAHKAESESANQRAAPIHRAVDSELMQVEARFVFNFCDSLTDPFYTVHDSIGVRASIAQEVEEQFLAELDKFLADDEWL